MQHEVCRAALATGDPAAGRAAHHWGIAAAVEKDQALLTAAEALLDRQHEGS